MSMGLSCLFLNIIGFEIVYSNAYTPGHLLSNYLDDNTIFMKFGIIHFRICCSLDVMNVYNFPVISNCFGVSFWASLCLVRRFIFSTLDWWRNKISIVSIVVNSNVALQRPWWPILVVLLEALQLFQVLIHLIIWFIVCAHIQCLSRPVFLCSIFRLPISYLCGLETIGIHFINVNLIILKWRLPPFCFWRSALSHVFIVNFFLIFLAIFKCHAR